MKYTKTDKAVTVLRALDQGHKIKVDDYTYALGIDGHDNTHLCYVGVKKDSDGEVGESLLVAEVSVGRFIDMCGELSQDEIFSIGANIILTAINSGKGER